MVMTSGDPRIRVNADFLFEVDPKSEVFDVVRERVNDAIGEEYAGLLSTGDLRAHVRTNNVSLEPDSWHVDVTIDADDSELRADLYLPADGDAEAALIEYIEDEAAERFGIDVDRLRFKKVRLAPGAWFVDAVYDGG